MSRVLGRGASKGKKKGLPRPQRQGTGDGRSARLGRECGPPGTHSARAGTESSGKPEFPPLESSCDRSLAQAEVGGGDAGRARKETRLCPPPSVYPESFWAMPATPLPSVVPPLVQPAREWLLLLLKISQIGRDPVLSVPLFAHPQSGVSPRLRAQKCLRWSPLGTPASGGPRP